MISPAFIIGGSVNDLINEKTMTVKEVSEVFNCSEDTILRAVNNLWPGKTKMGIRLYLNESEVTAVKLKIEGHHNLRSTEELPKTDLEKALLIKQAMQFQDELIDKLKKENEIMKPKAIIYDKFMYSEEYKSITEFANVLGIGRNKLFDKLRNLGILKKDNTPYQEYLDRDYFKVIYVPVTIGLKVDNKPQTYIKPKGMEFISKLVEKK